MTANSLKTETPIMPTDNTSKQVTNSKDLVKPNDDEFASKPHYPVLDGLHEHIDGTPIVTLVQGMTPSSLIQGEQQRWSVGGLTRLYTKSANYLLNLQLFFTNCSNT